MVAPTPTESHPFVVNVDFSKVAAHLRVVAERCEGGLAGPVISRALFNYIGKVTGEYFEAGAGPEGPWTPLKPSTLAKRRMGRVSLTKLGLKRGATRAQIGAARMATGGIKILMDNGMLRQAATLPGAAPSRIRYALPSGLIYGVNLPYAKFIQEGTSKMAARPYIGLRPEHIEDIKLILLTYILATNPNLTEV